MQMEEPRRQMTISLKLKVGMGDVSASAKPGNYVNSVNRVDKSAI